MKVIGIIAEYNPMHNGHIHQIRLAKEKYSASHVIVIMSGSFTQNGNISLLDKYTKASICIKNGADLIIELPTIYATSSSENFAYGAVSLLNSLNIVDEILFGAECKDVQILENIAKKLIDNEKQIISDIDLEEKKSTFAKNRSEVLKNYLTAEEYLEISKPNNILGIEYIKNIIKLNSNIKFNSISRIDNISSTKIREALKNNDYTYIKENSATDVYEYLSNIDISKLYTDNNYLNKLYMLIRYKIITTSLEDLKNIYEVAEGLENKLKKEIVNSASYEEFISNMKSKRYTLARIKRILINVLLGITKDFYDDNIILPSYAHILKFSDEGAKIISNISKASNTILITSYKENMLNKVLSDNLEKNKIINMVDLDILATNIRSTIFNSDLNIDYTNQIK